MVKLEQFTERIAQLPLDERGYPVPWFVQWIDGKPEFRAMDIKKWQRAVRENLCWVCGGRMGKHKAFVIGPMCGVNRTSSEPPSHLDCAEWSARNCPFLSQPRMVRDRTGLEGAKCPGGIMIERNPGVVLIWTTTFYKVWDDGRGGKLIEFGPPENIKCYRAGREATRAEIEESISTGLPLLHKMAEDEGEHAVEALTKSIALFRDQLERFNYVYT